MTEESLQAFIQKYKDIIDKRLPELIDSLETPPNLKESMIYSLNAGGKRIRPLLMLAVLKAYDSLFDDAYDIACAAEWCIHILLSMMTFLLWMMMMFAEGSRPITKYLERP